MHVCYPARAMMKRETFPVANIYVPTALRKTLELVRQRGCAIEDEESEIGMRCIAAPIRDDSGDVIAAIGLAGPISRLSKKALSAFIPHVIETAAAISARLGFRTHAAG